MSRALGKHWFNNGQKEGYFFECPDGWVKGRLPVSEETKQKQRKNTAVKNLSDEKKRERIEKIKETKRNKSIEEKRLYSLHLSEARKGKNKGQIPWNKGKKGVQQAWNKGLKLPKTKDQIEHMKQARAETMLKNNTHYGTPGKKAWNKGLTYHLDEQSRINMVNKMMMTKKIHGTLNVSKPEDEYKIYLEEKYGQDDVIPQYTDARYPFRCDFYIKSKDLFIELNFHWSHGGHLFDKDNPDDLKMLERWKEKSAASEFYKNAITTWTLRDVKKHEVAKKNNLNYIVYYNKEDLYND